MAAMLLVPHYLNPALNCTIYLQLWAILSEFLKVDANTSIVERKKNSACMKDLDEDYEPPTRQKASEDLPKSG